MHGYWAAVAPLPGAPPPSSRGTIATARKPPKPAATRVTGAPGAHREHVATDHEQHGEVLDQVLNRDGMAGADAFVPAGLQQRVEGTMKKPPQAPRNVSTAKASGRWVVNANTHTATPIGADATG
jgi:hypothetical protein